jgi:hypothetical protein
MPENRALQRLEENRRAVEERLADLQTAFDRELGWAPKAKAWVIPLAGFAVGLTLAGGIVGRKKRRAGRRA